MSYCLRKVTDEDHQWLVDLHNDPQVLMNLTNPNEISLETHIQWWNSIKQNFKEERLIFYVDDVKAGFAKFYNIDGSNRNCILGADLHHSFRGKGLAKHMWSLMLDRCFQFYHLNRVSLTTAEYNIIAQKVYASLGFKIEGRLVQSLFRNGVFHDQICMYMLHSDWTHR